MDYLKTYINSVPGVSPDVKRPHGIWQIWEENETHGVSLALGFQLDANANSPNIEKADESDEIVLAAKTRVLAQGPDRSKDMVESWNLASTELWYYIRATQRHRKSERLDLLGSVAY